MFDDQEVGHEAGHEVGHEAEQEPGRVAGLEALVGFWPGESVESLAAEDDLAFEVTCRDLADGWVEPARHVLPDLESIPVGPFLAVVVGSVDRSRLNGHDLVRLLRAEARLEAADAARKLASVAEVAYCPPGGSESPVERDPGEVEYAAVEVAAALTLTRRASETLLDQALWLSSRGRRVGDVLAGGRISVAKAREFGRHLSHLDSETVDSVLDVTLDDAAGLTTGQLRHRIQKQVMTVDPDGSESSMDQGLKERKVVSHVNPDFTGCLHICSVHPVGQAKALRHVDQLARSLKHNGDGRTLDQLRADIALDLLQGKTLDRVPAGGGRVHLTVSLETLAGLSHSPGDLDGYGPVIADIARRISLDRVDGHWTWSVVDKGDVLATGTTRYRPSTAQQRMAHAAYPTCVAPGRRMPAYNCDLDHASRPSVELKGVSAGNSNLSVRTGRHHTQWQYQRLPNGDHASRPSVEL